MNKKQPNLSSKDAMIKLIQGNARFVNGLKSVKTFPNSSLIKNLAEKGQRPFSVVFTCSDSRCPVETIFDCGFGELFVVRNFGLVLEEYAISSIEYALLNFDIQLIVLLGTSLSGGIRSTIENEKSSDKNENLSYLKAITNVISPSLNRARIKEKYFDDLKNRSSARDKVIHTTCSFHLADAIKKLASESKIINKMLKDKELSIVPAYYDISEGQVGFDLEKELKAKLLESDLHSEPQRYGETINEIVTSANLIDSEPTRVPRTGSGGSSSRRRK